MIEDYSRPVAIVDDDPAVLDSFRFLLEMAGFPVVAFPSALAFLQSDNRRTRCVIVDQNMPQMTGLELAANLRADGDDVPILLVSSLVSPTMAAKAWDIGVGSVLEKPLQEKDVITFIRSCRPE